MRLKNLCIAVITTTVLLAGDTSLASSYSIASFNDGRFTADEDGLPMNSAFNVGSIAKYVCTLAVLSARTEGLLSLEDSLSEHLDLDSTPSIGSIRIKHLLTNRSGVSNNFEELIKDDPNFPTNVITTNEAIAKVINPKTEFAAGTQFDYEIANWLIVQALLETVFRKSIEEVIDQWVIAPLKLQHTRVMNKVLDTKNERLLQANARPIPQFLTCGGGLQSSASDLIRLARGPFRSLDAESIHLLTQISTPSQSYALGGRMKQVSIGGETVLISHQAGTNGDFKVSVLYIPSLDKGLAVLAVGKEISITDIQNKWLDSLAPRAESDKYLSAEHEASALNE